MDADNNPFTEPSRTSSSSDANEVDTTAIGIAITADVRRSPSPSNHEALFSGSAAVSQNSADILIHHHQLTASEVYPSPTNRTYRSSSRGSSGQGTNWHTAVGLEHHARPTSVDEQLARPSRVMQRTSHRRSASSEAENPGLPEASGRRGSSASFDTASPTRRSSSHGVPTPPRRRGRRPPVSMRRAPVIFSANEHATVGLGIRDDSFEPRNPRRTGRVFSDSPWPASAFDAPTTPAQNRGRSIVIQTPVTPPSPGRGAARSHVYQPSVSSTGSLIGVGHETPRNDTRQTSQISARSTSMFFHARRHSTKSSDHSSQSETDKIGFFGRIMRRLSSIGPLDDNTSISKPIPGGSSRGSKPPKRIRWPSVSTARSDGSTGPAKLHKERKPSFRDPFRGAASRDDLDARLTGGRRASAPGPRRPSALRRMSRLGIPENPVPPRYRTKSVSSLGYFIAPVKKINTTIPIFEEETNETKANVEEFMAAVELRHSRTVRKPWEVMLFKIAYFLVLLCVIYFIFVGQPLWTGAALALYRWVNSDGIPEAGSAVFMSWAGIQAFLPLIGTRFEQEVDDVEKRDASEVALVIPAYKAAKILPETIRHALKIFKPEQIFIMANGNSPTPMDDTAEVCKEFGVNVAWVPIGSKITAEFVGVALTSKFKYILLIDDDVHLPPNLPIVTDRIRGNTKCVGYTIKSTGENGSKGTIVQQCQDVEYKLSGLTRTFCAKFGSATFPHGAIILWDRATLQSLFNVHPGYAISEDWFFGYSARCSGYRIQFCSQVFVETETPPSLIFTSGSARGGFGEMTVFKQRFYRWNFFWAHRLWEDSVYMLFSWRLGWREIVTKLWVLVELYDCSMAFLRPWLIVLGALANWKLLLIFIAALTGMYACAFIMFNAWHLRKKNEMVAWKIMPCYMAMKFGLMWMNVASVYWDLYCYAKYFSIRRPRVIESRKVLEVAYQARGGIRSDHVDA